MTDKCVYGCKLVAVDTGEGWGLYVEKDGEQIAELNWDEVIGKNVDRITAKELRNRGYEVV